MIVGRMENWHECFPDPVWKRAFEFLAGLGPGAEEGETPIDGDKILARVMSYETRPPEGAVLETHRRNIDIQTTLVGAERIDWFPVGALEVKQIYDENKDVTFYRRPGEAPAHVDVHPGTFVVLFPEDAHMAQLPVGEPRLIKKAVVKVKLSLIR